MLFLSYVFIDENDDGFFSDHVENHDEESQNSEEVIQQSPLAGDNA